jgi:hypothetical protein
MQNYMLVRNPHTKYCSTCDDIETNMSQMQKVDFLCDIVATMERDRRNILLYILDYIPQEPLLALIMSGVSLCIQSYQRGNQTKVYYRWNLRFPQYMKLDVRFSIGIQDKEWVVVR